MNEIVKEVQKVLPAEMEDVAEQAERPQRIPFRAVENKNFPRFVFFLTRHAGQ